MRLKKLTLIKPNMGNYHAGDVMPPLALGMLAARTPEAVSITFFDDRIEKIPFDDRPDLVAITVETFTAVRAYEISKSYREKGIPVVMGGYHPTLLPDEVAEYADVVVIGDAEGVWEKILTDFENNNLQPVYSGGNQNSLDNYVIDRSIFKGKKYLSLELIQYSRGCRYNCDFCSISSFYNQQIRVRTIKSIVNEIKGLNRKQLLFFVDDNILGLKENFILLLDALKKMKVRWACQISIDVAEDEKLLDKLAASGCLLVLIGFESLEEKNLKQMGKKWNTRAGSYFNVIKKFHSRGIAVYGTFVCGYGNDTLKTISDCRQFAIDAKLEIANFNLLIPTPGTSFYKRLKHEDKLILDKWWLDPAYQYGTVVFSPEKISPAELYIACFNAKKQFYSFSSIFRRLFLTRTKFSLFQFTRLLIINLVSRREIGKKQNKTLGDV